MMCWLVLCIMLMIVSVEVLGNNVCLFDEYFDIFNVFECGDVSVV